MQEAKASWNTLYLDKNGFECQLTLRDDDETALAERVASITSRILESGGKPVVRRNGNGGSSARGEQTSSSRNSEQPEKTYVDGKGVRRCNLNLGNGKRCNQQVVEKEGRYGLFWSCPNYKNHASQSSK